VDRELAALLARYSALAYERPAVVAAALPGAKITFIDRDDSQAYIIECDAHAAVAFRGTQVFSGFSGADIASNLWVRREPWDPGNVHRGYREAILDIAHEVKGVLHAPKRLLYFTGHSLGGALATLASTLPPGPTATYTFGAPRVGNAAFAAALRNVFRIVHADDIAPKYPLPLGYRHGGEAWHLAENGALVRSTSVWDQVIVPFTGKGIAKGVLDHRVGEYVRKLAQVPVS
jgi:triacylglycerol lipase